MAQFVEGLQDQRQRSDASRNLAHDDFDEVALVYQVAHKFRINTKWIEAHDNYIVQEIFLALREHAFGIFEVVY